MGTKECWEKIEWKKENRYTYAVIVRPVIFNSVLYIQVNRKGFWNEGNE